MRHPCGTVPRCILVVFIHLTFKLLPYPTSCQRKANSLADKPGLVGILVPALQVKTTRLLHLEEQKVSAREHHGCCPHGNISKSRAKQSEP